MVSRRIVALDFFIVLIRSGANRGILENGKVEAYT